MAHGRLVSLHQLIGRLAGALVQRREHDVEAFENVVRKIEPSIRQDIGFAAVEDRDVRVALAQLRNLGRLVRDTLGRQVTGCRRARRVIGDGEVFIAKGPAA